MSMTMRASATQKTLNGFKGKPFKFGRYDCAQLVRRHLVHMKVPAKEWAKAGSYSSLIGGTKRLKELGFTDLHEALDARFDRIAPAFALVGDIIAMPGLEGPGALTVYLGNGKVLCWVDGEQRAVVGEMTGQFEAAWRVPA